MAFEEIPSVIMDGKYDHTEPYPGDGGYQFKLDPEEYQTFVELNDVRREFGMLPFRFPKDAKPPD